MDIRTMWRYLVVLWCASLETGVFWSTGASAQVTSTQSAPERPCSRDQSKLGPDNFAVIDKLRQKLVEKNLYGYIISNGDAHRQEMRHPNAAKTNSITGSKSKSAMFQTAFVTAKSQVLFIGSFFVKRHEIDCTWEVVSTIRGMQLEDWIVVNVPADVRVGMEAAVVSPKIWDRVEAAMNKTGAHLVETPDLLELGNLRAPENLTVFTHDVKYAGQDWTKKITDLVQGMHVDDTDAIVLTSSTDVGWLFNLRGSYYPHAPYFPSFAVIISDNGRRNRALKIWLYVKNMRNLSDEVREHLRINNCPLCVEVSEYQEFYPDLQRLNADTSIRHVILDFHARQAVLSRVDASKRSIVHTPVALMKTVKNSVELDGMRNACKRDAVYTVRMIFELEKRTKSGDYMTELDASELLDTFRAEDELRRGNAFNTISGFANHTAMIHYFPTNNTNQKITTKSMYMIDTGGQYLDGTVDATRTFHFGQPTDDHRELYTRVLLGCIDALSTIWTTRGGKPGYLTLLGVKYLWDLGYDLPHGLGHGIGQFGDVHEEPVNLYHDPSMESYYYQAGVVQTVEPGAYFPYNFGVRLETMAVVVDKGIRNYSDVLITMGPRFAFEPIYFFPFERHLIKRELLSNFQIMWLNKYHKKCLDTLGPELLNRGLKKEYEWLKNRTLAIEYNFPPQYAGYSSANSADSVSTNIMFCYVFVSFMTWFAVICR